MFGWRKRRKAIPIEETEHYKLGQQAANGMANDLDAFMRRRFSSVFENYLDVLRKRLHACFAGGDAPPLTLARIEYDVFRQNVEEMKPKMVDESVAAISEWGEVFEQIDGGEGISTLVNHRVDTFCGDLLLAGLKLLTDYAEGLKDADVHWRREHPETAAKFPEPS